MRRAAIPAVIAACLLVAACDSPSTPGAARRSRLLDDPSSILDAGASRRVRSYLDWVGEEYGIDYHVVLAALEGRSPERRALELFEERATGSASGGRGLLLLVDPSARVVRVEVGYALEPYVTDVAASRMLSGYLAPYFRTGETAAGIEASIEALVDVIRPQLGASASRDPIEASGPVVDERELTAAPSDGGARRRPPSGGGGASLDLLRELPDDRLDDSSRAALRAILVPQPDARQARDLEIALLHKGLYFQEATLYDEAWRRAARPGGWSPARLREIARQWDRPYELVIEAPLAIAFYPDARALGPTFLRRAEAGWTIDASETARTIVYDYSNQGWFARDGASPYLALLRRALPLERVTLQDGGGAWAMK